MYRPAHPFNLIIAAVGVVVFIVIPLRGQLVTEVEVQAGPSIGKFDVLHKNYVPPPEVSPGWAFISLPANMQPVQVSRNGTVLLSDSNYFYRWQNGAIETLHATYPSGSWVNPVNGLTYGSGQPVTAMNAAGEIALNFRFYARWSLSGSRDDYYDEVNWLKKWTPGANTFTEYDPQSFNFTTLQYYFGSVNHLTQKLAILKALDDTGTQWVLIGDQVVTVYEHFGNLEQRLLNKVVRISSSGTITQTPFKRAFESSSYRLNGVSASGVAIGWVRNAGVTKYYVGDNEVNFQPSFINRNGWLIGAPIGASVFVQEPDGTRSALPTDGYVNWIDDQNRLNGYYYPPQGGGQRNAVWIRREGAPLTYERKDYARLQPPPPWSTTHEVAPGSTSIQLGLMTRPTGAGAETRPFLAVPCSIAVDANRDGQIKLASEDASDATSSNKPYRFWLNDDFDRYGSVSPPAVGAIPDFARDNVGASGDDFKDFVPVFLDIKQLVRAFPPDSGSGITYKLKQANGALKFFYTSLTRANAFAYRNSPNIYSQSTIHLIDSTGVTLDRDFLYRLRDQDQGVILVEGNEPTTQPLVLVVEKDGVAVAEVSLPLSVGQDIVLLLHGMNSNTDTWQQFVDSHFGGLGAPIVADIRDGDIWGYARRNSAGVVCYRVQFGAYDLASTRVGLEDVRATDPGYDTVTRRCGDFETFEELGTEVGDAITLLRARHRNARIVLVGHSRGGLSARAFLEGPSATADNTAAKAAVIGLLTSSSPNLGSRIGRIYGWLNTYRRDHPQTDEDDWEVVDFLRGVGLPWAVLPELLDVRRPVILDVADNSLAIAELNSATALLRIPASIRCTEIQYAYARIGLLNRVPVRYSVFEPTGFLGGPLPQLSDPAKEFLLAGGDPGDIGFIGDGLISRANQRFTQLTGFSAVALPARVITGREVVHIEAPKQTVDLLEQLKSIAPEMFP